MAGLLTYFLPGRLPIHKLTDSGRVCPGIHEDYSSGYCAGFSPASLLSPIRLNEMNHNLNKDNRNICILEGSGQFILTVFCLKILLKAKKIKAEVKEERFQIED